MNEIREIEFRMCLTSKGLGIWIHYNFINLSLFKTFVNAVAFTLNIIPFNGFANEFPGADLHPFGLHYCAAPKNTIYLKTRYERKPKMDFERYYLDLFDMLNGCCKKIASGNYDKSDSERLFELSKKGRYPSILAELAESFGMMLVKVEAREFERLQIIDELEAAKAKLEDYSKKLEKEIEECCPEESRKD
jgi:hypothetical protein